MGLSPIQQLQRVSLAFLSLGAFPGAISLSLGHGPGLPTLVF